jgi:hypothetical protein
MNIVPTGVYCHYLLGTQLTEEISCADSRPADSTDKASDICPRAKPGQPGSLLHGVAFAAQEWRQIISAPGGSLLQRWKLEHLDSQLSIAAIISWRTSFLPSFHALSLNSEFGGYLVQLAYWHKPLILQLH